MSAAPVKRRRTDRERVLKPVRPNHGLQLEYQHALEHWIDEMQDSVLYWVRAKFKQNEPVIVAEDELPATAMRRAVGRLSRRWQRNFGEAAPKLADWFADAATERSDKQLQKILRDGGFSVRFKMTRAQRDIVNATTNANVGLIKSIPQQYLGQVEGAVMRSIQAGRDLHQLTKDIEDIYGVTRRRAELIARDQNNKATSAMNQARLIELKLYEASWMHSLGGKEPRPTHLAAGRRKQIFDVRIGWYDPQAIRKKGGSYEGRFIQPGELINCKCGCRPILPGV